MMLSLFILTADSYCCFFSTVIIYNNLIYYVNGIEVCCYELNGITSCLRCCCFIICVILNRTALLLYYKHCESWFSLKTVISYLFKGENIFLYNKCSTLCCLMVVTSVNE